MFTAQSMQVFLKCSDKWDILEDAGGLELKEGGHEELTILGKGLVVFIRKVGWELVKSQENSGVLIRITSNNLGGEIADRASKLGQLGGNSVQFDKVVVETASGELVH